MVIGSTLVWEAIRSEKHDDLLRVCPRVFGLYAGHPVSGHNLPHGLRPPNGGQRVEFPRMVQRESAVAHDTERIVVVLR